MARTLIGSLILRLKADGLKEADKVVQTLKEVENTARRMGAVGVGSWGVGFQKQLNALKLSTKDIQEVERSWVRLHESIKSRGIDKAAGRLDVSHWKTNTLAVLAQQKADLDRHFNDVEKKTRGHMMRMRDIMKAGIVATGVGYTLPYAGGMAIRGGLTASSERRRELFRQQMAGIPDAEQQKLFDASEATAQKYPSIPVTDVMEMSRSAFTVMGDAERAAAILDKMAASLVVLQSARGTDAAANMLVSMIRGLDNLGANKDGQVGIDQVNEMIAAVTRATQVDPDFDPGQFFDFARATKVAGPALSMDFLARTPVFMQDMGSGSTGNALAMAFRAFVLEAVGSAGGKKYLAERDRLGIRQNGKLVDSELFGSDPDRWVLKHLVPALQKDGVDLNNDTQVAAAVGKLSGNTTATGFLTRVITQREQIERWLGMMDKAIGPDAAGDVRFQDPFVGFEAFKKAFENLAAALIPIDTINAGLNSLADGINALAGIAEDNPGLTALGLGGVAAGTVAGAKTLYDKLGNAFGLRTAASELTLAAKMLQQAAGAQGTGLPGDGTGGNPLKDIPFREKVGRNGWLFAVFDAIAGMPDQITSLSDADRENLKEKDRLIQFSRPRGGNVATSDTSEFKDALGAESSGGGIRDSMMGVGVQDLLKSQEIVVPTGDWRAPAHEPARTKGGVSDVRPMPGGPIQPEVDTTAAKAEVDRAAEEMTRALDIKGVAKLDSSAIDTAIAKARTLISVLQQATTMATAAASAADRQMRRNMADYGVSP